jgi:hypothetical protein
VKGKELFEALSSYADLRVFVTEKALCSTHNGSENMFTIEKNTIFATPQAGT